MLRKVILITGIIFSLSLAVYYYYAYFLVRIPPKLDSVPIGIEVILIFIFSFSYFFEQMNDGNNLFIYNKPSFWAVLGILIYLSGSFFIYIFANQITIKELGKYWVITNISSIVKNIFFAIAIYIQAADFVKKPMRDYKFYRPNQIL